MHPEDPTTMDLRPLVKSGEFVRIVRSRPSAPRLNGYVLACSDSLALMHIFDDFAPDGYSVLRIDDIQDIDRDEHQRHWHRMLAGEDLLGGLDLGFRPDLSAMHAAVESIWRQYHHIIIHCEAPDEPIQDFYIGYPLAVGPGGVIFRHFDARGRWHPMPDVINVAEITRVEFDAPYINRFSKYLTDPSPE